MNGPHDTQFDRDLALTDTDQPYVYEGSFDARWYIDRSLHGGHVISAVVRAFERAVADPERAMRSITVHYVRPARVGPYTIEVVIDRTGRSLSNARAQITQDGTVIASAMAALGGQWASIEWDRTVMPEVAPPEECPVLWTEGDASRHKLLKHIGLEPFDPACDGDCLHRAARKRTVAIRDLLLNGRIIAGIGNIYANEALFAAGIRPSRAAGRISRARCARLVEAVRAILARAIEAGGTTLRDFQQADGRPGYFRQELSVYGRAGEPCPRCRRPIRAIALGQRRAFYCPHCQT